MERDPVTQAALLRRLRSVSGHVNGVEKMVEEGKYCIDIIHQIQAVQSALNKVTGMLLDDHMHHCVTEAIQSRDPSERERVLGEIRDVFTVRNRY
jgi:CsoR family transcriptional regulator, copper-sensing transcriptional repressor